MKIQCPYCNSCATCTDTEDGRHVVVCGACGKTFIADVEICRIVKARVRPADCLNSGKHELYPVYCWPGGKTVWTCSVCGHECNARA